MSGSGSPRAVRWAVAAAALMGAVACGAGAEEGGGDSNLPTRLAGPYKALPEDPRTPIAEPKVLEDEDGDWAFYGPSAFSPAEGEYTVFFTADNGSRAEIRRADGVDLANEPRDMAVVLEASATTWEASRVAHPALLQPGLTTDFGLFFQGGDGEIGYASSDDGFVFTRHADNPLVSASLPEEGARVGEPTAVWSGDTVLLYYAAQDPGAIFLASLTVDANGAVTVEKVDPDPATPAHDPVLGPNPFAGQFDEAAVGAPTITITNDSGRPVYDMWYSGVRADGDLCIGFAGSYDGLLFKRFDENPVLKPGIPAEADPSVITYEFTAVMFYTLGTGLDRAVGAATY
ncbi:MAG: hypothetical protein ABI333_18330 [bacterium]